MQHNELSEMQRCFVTHMLEHCDPKIACEKTGMDYHSVQSWLRNPQFKLELAYRRRLIAERIGDEISKVALKAVLKLGEIITSPDSSRSDALKASSTMLELLYKAIDYNVTQSRLDELDRRAGIDTSR